MKRDEVRFEIKRDGKPVNLTTVGLYLWRIFKTKPPRIVDEHMFEIDPVRGGVTVHGLRAGTYRMALRGMVEFELTPLVVVGPKKKVRK